MEAILFGLFGLIVGSFLNVVVIRRGAKSIGGRSACVSCEASIAWYDNVPLLSWCILRGRCRHCGSGISIQYPLVEALTGALFALMGATSGSLLMRLTGLFILAVLVLIAVYDVRHTIIPDEWVYGFAGAALLFSLVFAQPEGSSASVILLSGPLAALPLFALWFVSGGRWMGFGDVKLALGIGWLLGPLWGIFSVLFSFVVGAVISVAILMPLPVLLQAVQKAGIARLRSAAPRLTMKSEVPFGPFLIGSCVFVWFSLLYHLPLPL